MLNETIRTKPLLLSLQSNEPTELHFNNEITEHYEMTANLIRNYEGRQFVVVGKLIGPADRILSQNTNSNTYMCYSQYLKHKGDVFLIDDAAVFNSFTLSSLDWVDDTTLLHFAEVVCEAQNRIEQLASNITFSA